jgi:hypothetical protein
MRLMRFTFVSLTSIVRSNSRLTRADLRRRKCDFIPLAERICPVAVKVKRLFAPLCVFSFCFATTVVAFLFQFLLEGGENHRHRPPLDFRRLLDRAVRTQQFAKLVE